MSQTPVTGHHHTLSRKYQLLHHMAHHLRELPLQALICMISQTTTTTVYFSVKYISPTTGFANPGMCTPVATLKKDFQTVEVKYLDE